MNPTAKLDIDDQARDISRAGIALSQSLDHLANAAPAPLNFQLTALAFACELMADKAEAIAAAGGK